MLDFAYPVDRKYIITSPFGGRPSPTAGASSNHQGIDIGVPVGSNVLAAMAGKITQNGYSSARGNYVEVEHSNGFKTIYQHLQSSLFKIGDTVTKGQVIAKSGNTGITTGPHLHFEMKQNGNNVNPTMFNMTSSGGENITNTLTINEEFSATQLLDFIKDKWWIFAIGLVILALLPKK